MRHHHVARAHRHGREDVVALELAADLELRRRGVDAEVLGSGG
jgi:hypothetical protein